MNELRFLGVSLFLVLSLLTACSEKEPTESASNPVENFVEVSSGYPAYLELSDGTPYIPIGLNLIAPSGSNETEESALQEVETWMRNLSENGGNFVRIWLSHRFWDIENEKAGEYNEAQAEKIDRFISLARKYGLRVKMTLEHFRGITLEETNQAWATKFIYHTSRGGPLNSIDEYITNETGHRLFLDKLDYYQDRYGVDTIFFGWELWNEMNAVRVSEDSAFFAWNKKMLKELKSRFPENLAMQSLGSFDKENKREVYRQMMTMPENEIAQIHRYLDLGAPMEICHGPADVLAADAIRELQSYQTGKPQILAETGGVEPRHTGPIRYYAKDTAGIILHDVLFAPFFAGSAGPGMIWHWGQYVHSNNLWYHYGRFSKAIEGINPVKEKFKPQFSETDKYRIYGLTGHSTILLWLRDKHNNWKTELEEGVPPQLLMLTKEEVAEFLPENYSSFQIYDPWQDKWSEPFSLSKFPESFDFYRSLVLKVMVE